VGDGALHIIARQEAFGGANYTSARLKTLGRFSKLYGRFEFRARVPRGQGYWPALWMMPRDSVYGSWAASGEIDVMENKGSAPTVVGGTLHYGGRWPSNVHQGSSFTFTGGESATNFHVYALEWTTNAFRWYVDGQLYRTQTSWWSSGGDYPAPFNQPFFILMNLAVGGNYGGNPDGTTVFPGVIQVDYVRVYDFSPTPVPPLRLVVAGTTKSTFLLGGSNGPPAATFYLLTSASVANGTGNWARLATNQFDAAGKFLLSVPAVSPASFYRLQVP
jgi:beta-glucanase (GH16 family)